MKLWYFGLFTLFVGVICLPLHAADETLAYSPAGTDGCLMCHGADRMIPAADILSTPHGRKGNPNSPFAEGNQGCESCHGPSALHLTMGPDGKRHPPGISFHEGMDPDVMDSGCTGCHKDTTSHWAGSAHQFEEIACVSCHTVHSESNRDKARLKTDLCLDCHPREKADIKRKSAHPISQGLLGCTDCHDPHGGAGPALQKFATTNQGCYDCHAGMRGPFLFEHAPVREDCTACHVPHGSNHESLLSARTPFLCQQCHLANFHPSTLLDGKARPPEGASHLLLGKDCMNCHSKVHGSNHPSGAGLTR